MAGNSALSAAVKAKKDEFYTQLTDIEKEMRYYRKHFKGKTVLCNCDDPFESNFFKYFVLNFNRLGRVSELMADEDVSRKSGVYEYLLTGKEKALSIRAFDQHTKREAYERQGHKCAICGEEFEFEQMHGDHIQPWSKGGHTTPDNCQMLCRDCNLKKGAQ